MNRPQKEEKMKKEIDDLKDEVYAARREADKLKKRIEELTAAQGVVLDETSQNDLVNIMKHNHANIHQQFPEGTFQRIFWDQQLQAAKVGNLKTDKMASMHDQVVLEFKADIISSISCNEVIWFYHLTIRMHIKRLHQLHQGKAWISATSVGNASKGIEY